MTNENLGKNIKRVRKLRGRTQIKLAEGAKLSENVIAKIEMGYIKNPRISTVAAIARCLDVPIDELLI